MTTYITIKMDGDEALIRGRVANTFGAEHLLKSALDDIADEIEKQAKIFAPEDSGELKAHPVDREDTRIEHRPGFFSPGFGTRTNIAAFGGGTSVRGPGGRFIKQSEFREPLHVEGAIVGRSVLTVATEPFYAKFVHDGTGVYGPTKRPITPHTADFMVFPHSRFPTAVFVRKTYRFKSVLGQKAQPYLTEAYLLIDRTYAPARVSQLRAELAAL